MLVLFVFHPSICVFKIWNLFLIVCNVSYTIKRFAYYVRVLAQTRKPIVQAKVSLTLSSEFSSVSMLQQEINGRHMVVFSVGTTSLLRWMVWDGGNNSSSFNYRFQPTQSIILLHSKSPFTEEREGDVRIHTLHTFLYLSAELDE